MERGSDRMALITGRIKTLDSPSSSSTHHHFHTQSSPALFFHHQQTSSSLDVGLKDEHDAFGASLKHDFGDGFSRTTAFDFGSRVEPQLRKCDTNTEAVRTPAMELEDKFQPSSPIVRVPKTSDDAEPFPEAYGIYLNFFTPKEISSCIMATENTRVFCSIMIAVLVVMSYVNLPRTIVKSKSIIASRPLYVLLLTDVAIVIARLTLGKQRISEKAKEKEETGLQKDGHNWGGAVRVLELGLVVHQTIRAIFIDCSFYMVIVICGLSLL